MFLVFAKTGLDRLSPTVSNGFKGAVQGVPGPVLSFPTWLNWEPGDLSVTLGAWQRIPTPYHSLAALAMPCLVVGRVQVQGTQKGYVSSQQKYVEITHPNHIQITHPKYHKLSSICHKRWKDQICRWQAFFGHEHPWGRRWHEGAYSLINIIISNHKVSINGGTKNGWFMMENLIEKDRHQKWHWNVAEKLLKWLK